MSWGERSCKYPSTGAYDKKPCEPEMHTCNVNCPLYIWDEVTEPDSRKNTMNLKENLTLEEIEEAAELVANNGKTKKLKGSQCFNCGKVVSRGVFAEEIQCGVCASKYGGMGEQIKRRQRQEER